MWCPESVITRGVCPSGRGLRGSRLAVGGCGPDSVPVAPASPSGASGLRWLPQLGDELSQGALGSWQLWGWTKGPHWGLRLALGYPHGRRQLRDKPVL